MPEELGFKASIEGFDKVEAGLNAITKDLTATSNAANKLSSGPLKAVSKSLDGLTLSSDKFNTASKKTTVELAATAIQASKVDSSLKKAAAGTNTAAFALTNLGRVAQDAPFGFIGIQNNLNPLLESFQRLRAESGSTGAALKALGGSLLGGAGIGLAISVVTGLLTVLTQNGFFKSTKAAEENTEAIKLSVSAYDKFESELSKVISTIGQEATKVSILFSALSDNNIGLRERKGIIEQLNAISPGYLGNLDKEKATYAEITKAVFAYTNSLAQSAEIKALLPQVEEIFNKVIKAQVELNQLRRFQNGILGLSEEDFKKEEKRLNDQIILYTKQIQQAKKGLEFIAGGALNLSEILFGKTPNLNKVVSKVTDEFGKLKKVLLEVSEIRFVEKGRFDEFLRNIKPDSKVFNAVTIPVRPEIILPDLGKGAENDQFFLFGVELSKALTAGLNTGLEQLLEGVAIQFGEALGNAITGTAEIGNIFNGLFKAIGAGLKQLGGYFIQTAIQVKIFKELITKNPYLAIAAGVALIALGQVISNATSKKQAFATGGLVGGTGNRDTVNAMLTPGEFVITKSAVQRIGVDRLAAMNKGAAPTNFAGGGIVGGGGSVIIPDVVLRGSDLILVFDRASATKSRQG
jgi:hypothetical protein